MASRWERLLDQKPIPVLEALLDKVAQLLFEELERWPLPLEEIDKATGSGINEILAAPRPGKPVFREAFRLARWDLEREPSAIDDYWRNRRYLEHEVAPNERGALMFVARWLVEQLLSLKDATQSRVGRGDLIRCLDQVERRRT